MSQPMMALALRFKVSRITFAVRQNEVVVTRPLAGGWSPLNITIHRKNHNVGVSIANLPSSTADPHGLAAPFGRVDGVVAKITKIGKEDVSPKWTGEDLASKLRSATSFVLAYEHDKALGSKKEEVDERYPHIIGFDPVQGDTNGTGYLTVGNSAGTRSGLGYDLNGRVVLTNLDPRDGAQIAVRLGWKQRVAGFRLTNKWTADAADIFGDKKYRKLRVRAVQRIVNFYKKRAAESAEDATTTTVDAVDDPAITVASTKKQATKVVVDADETDEDITVTTPPVVTIAPSSAASKRTAKAKVSVVAPKKKTTNAIKVAAADAVVAKKAIRAAAASVVAKSRTPKKSKNEQLSLLKL